MIDFTVSMIYNDNAIYKNFSVILDVICGDLCGYQREEQGTEKFALRMKS